MQTIFDSFANKVLFHEKMRNYQPNHFPSILKIKNVFGFTKKLDIINPIIFHSIEKEAKIYFCLSGFGEI